MEHSRRKTPVDEKQSPTGVGPNVCLPAPNRAFARVAPTGPIQPTQDDRGDASAPHRKAGQDPKRAFQIDAANVRLPVGNLTFGLRPSNVRE